MKGLLNLETLSEDNIRTLKLSKERFKKPLVIILVGIPSSGKTTFSQTLSSSLPLVILSEEYMIRFLAPRATFFEKAQTETFQLAVKTMEKLVQSGVNCIYDSSIKKKSDRNLIKNRIEKMGGTYVLIYIYIPKELALERVSKQNFEVTRGEKKGFIMNKDLFEYEINSTQIPLSGENHLVYEESNPESLIAIKKYLKELLKPV
ncbi:MAG: hypothetical protein A2864_01680 [Candidatus Woykebacteria bacterium RIFCSPHIGHO2_01_FULL_39_12]|uniref:UDP-N-acetylglucosamine kinase n=2 Tax=Candidatus Woykeibacteriota TaxID=1817899 RepID=A0A1G1WD75_9BACT|nr:MAG: hypothetical protein A2134_03245 [Candidatus Woykebacteria bacterium RBG_16_39_9b]OGY27217.1 MAG: hypothetical protein A2864_01680 [Candidatus Woykebacteria bacterium RIFCSPHIGHO2_01_FULL_39_12]